jgi:TRAP transporter TAXI family solute receptor
MERISRIVKFRPILLVALFAWSSCAGEAEPPARPIRLLRASMSTQPGLQGLVDHYNAKLSGVKVSQEGTAGSVVVVSALQRGHGDLGIAQADVVYSAYRRGTEDAQFAHANLSAMAVLTANKLYVIARNGNQFRRIEDLRGRRVVVAQRGGSASELFTRVVLAAHGMNYSDIIVEFHPFDDMGRHFAAGTMDAMIIVSGTPVQAQMATVPHDVRVLPISETVIKALRAEYPFVKPLMLQSDELPRLTAPVLTVGVDSLLICRKDLEAELVYQLTKEFFAWPESPTRYPVDPDRAATPPIPLHPGAARYYREQEILK